MTKGSDDPEICRFRDSEKMSQVCEKCGKKPMTGHNVSHSHRKTKRRWLPNLQKAEIDGKKVRICAQCLKTLNKVRLAKTEK